MSRYQRHIQLAEIGEKGQERLGKAKVLVVGAGGLGCPALQYLAAAGVGQIGIVDGDQVSLHNLQRQVLFTEADLGKNKAEVAVKKLSQLNSEIQLKSYPFHLNLDNAAEIFSDYDVILDCTDNFVTRYLINDVSLRMGKAMIHGSLYKFEGQMGVFNYQNGPSYRCLFPDPPKPGDVPNCNEVGVLGVLPGLIGILQATEAIKIILEIGDILSGKILHYHLLSHEQRIFEVSRNEQEISRIKAFPFVELVSTNDCQFSDQISLRQLKKTEKILWIDVREEGEKPSISSPDLLSIPLSEFAEKLGLIPSEPKKLIFCQSGLRSQRALAQLKENQIPNCFSLIEGAEEVKKYIQT
ncbi:ThiF family adenylyltransferase [Algoriphagus namhaensis]